MTDEERNLLLCEDDPNTCNFWSLYFNEAGWNVFICKTPETAIRFLEDRDVEIQLGYFDVHFLGSNLTGFDVGRHVSLSMSPFPFFMMSMTRSEEKVKEAQRVGAVGFVEKSYEDISNSLKQFSTNAMQVAS